MRERANQTNGWMRTICVGRLVLASSHWFPLQSHQTSRADKWLNFSGKLINNNYIVFCVMCRLLCWSVYVCARGELQRIKHTKTFKYWICLHKQNDAFNGNYRCSWNNKVFFSRILFGELKVSFAPICSCIIWALRRTTRPSQEVNYFQRFPTRCWRSTRENKTKRTKSGSKTRRNEEEIAHLIRKVRIKRTNESEELKKKATGKKTFMKLVYIPWEN